MVLFKRKPVQFLLRPTIEDDNVEVWIIPETDEVFTSYESYLQRMDWYKQRKFICEISGHSGLSFFDALKSEKAGARDVENAFPEALKQPVLRKLQFSVVSRIDTLVDQIYDAFKTDYYPGEQVIVTKGNERHNGTIRDKATFSEARDPDTGVVTREAFARYIVHIDDETDAGETELLAEDVDIHRDRKVFTKQMLRSFIKNTVSREPWTGAPWLVKPDVARIYHVDTNVPPHLQHSHKLAEKRERKKAEQLLQHDGMFATWPSNKLPDLKPAKGGRKHASLSHDQLSDLQRAQWDEYFRLAQIDPAQAQAWHAQLDLPVAPPNGHAYAHPHAHYPVPPDGHHPPFPPGPPHVPSKHMPKAPPPPPPPPPVIKYPIEDMDCPPQRNGVQRPPLRFVTKAQTPAGVENDDIIPGLQENKVSMLLETWNTLNVYCQVLKLDSFTFDDFVDALQWSSTDIECDLLVEIHCAMLKQLVQDDKSGGTIQISLPDLPEPEDSEDDDEDEQEESRVSSPTPEPDVPARRTRSSLNRKAVAEQERENSRLESEAAAEQVPHRAAEMFTEDDTWIDRLRKRSFRNGGWQVILVGLLHQLAGRPRLTDACVKILAHLAPLDADPSAETVVFQYSVMDINLRAEALQILCSIFLETKTVKKFLEDMSATMTEYRKKKIEHQRTRKEAIATLKKLHDERKILAPLEMSPSPVAELEELEDAEKLAEAEIEEVADSEDERPITTRSLRRGQDRAAERKRKRDEEEQRRKKEQEEKASKGSKEYQKVLKAIEKERKIIAAEEEQIEIIDGDLREADAYRTRCLGKDRFCNRYWWFERNAMPYAGLPDSSTADADYANGRLWVQGPDDMERLGYIDVADDARNNYFRCFQMTPAERKALEEGPTNLNYATQWGFYDDVDAVDKLIDWLDSRGVRELKLKKELVLQRDIMAKYMANRQKYIHPEKATNGADNGDDEEEAEDEKIIPATTRMSTRTKTYASNQEDLIKAHRCLRWKNQMALHEIGHRHVDPPPAPVSKKGKATVKRPSGLSEVVNANAPRGTRASAASHKNEEQAVPNRPGKPVTRQGSRYSNA